VLTLMEVEKTICEGSGAAAVAAVMYGKLPELAGKQVAAVSSHSRSRNRPELH